MVVGICGGLDPDIPVGTVLRPDVVVDHATGARFRHTPPGDGPTSGGIVTTEDVTFDDDLSRALAARGFTGVDMESSAVAGACVARGRPWTVHRCISDRYVDRLLDPRIVALTDADGNVDVDAVVRLLDEDPTLGPRLDRLGRDAAEAARLAAEDALAACVAARSSGPGVTRPTGERPGTAHLWVTTNQLVDGRHPHLHASMPNAAQYGANRSRI